VKRWLITIAIFLLGGALANISVAWACTAWWPAPTRESVGASPWPSPVPANWEEPATCYVRSNWALTEINAVGFLRDRQDAAPMQYVFKAGFPCRSLSREVHGAPFYGQPYTMLSMRPPRTWQEGLAIPPLVHARFDRYLPLHPMPLGLAVNTIFYATALWCLARGLLFVRRGIRLRRGLCPKCAYPIGENDLCSECGNPVPQRAVV
jgi:hypothetical protein